MVTSKELFKQYIAYDKAKLYGPQRKVVDAIRAKIEKKNREVKLDNLMDKINSDMPFFVFKGERVLH